MIEPVVSIVLMQCGRPAQFADRGMDLLPVVEARSVALLAHFGRPLLRDGLCSQTVQAKHHPGGVPGILL